MLLRLLLFPRSILFSWVHGDGVRGGSGRGRRARYHRRRHAAPDSQRRRGKQDLFRFDFPLQMRDERLATSGGHESTLRSEISD